MSLLKFMNSPWAITPEKLAEIRDIYATHLRGEKIDLAGVEARLGKPLNNSSREFEVRDGVAIIAVEGILAPKMNMFLKISGGTSTQILGQQIREALDDDEVKAIILSVDSPGGAVTGTVELSNLIFEGRGKKPMVTFAYGLMASAAVWVGSATDKTFISSETTSVGSIGVVATHVDYSKYEDKVGVKTTEITAGKFKRIASDVQPLSQEGRDYIQAQVDEMYSIFIEHMARNRGVDADTVIKNMADGRMFVGRKAVKSGLVDGVSTLDALVKRLSQSGGESVPDNINANLENEGIEIMPEQNTPLTADSIKRDHPSVYADIVAREKEALIAEGRQEGLDIGAEQERQRIQAVEAQGENMPGHEKLIAGLKFDGKTTGPEAAEKILTAEKTKRVDTLKDIEDDAPDAVDEPDTPTGEADLSNLPVEDRCKAEWEKKPELKKEFSSVDAYIAAEKALDNGQARIKNN